MKTYVTSETLAEKTQQWLEQIAPYNTCPMELNTGRAALLIVDMQMYFLDESSHACMYSGLAVLPHIKRLIERFREAGRPVIFTRHAHSPDGGDLGIMGQWWSDMCIEGSPESEIHPNIAPRPEERVILKQRYSAFYNTDLEAALQDQNIEDVVICGVMTNLCCETTARDAFIRDYRVFFPADGTGSANEEMHLATLMNLAYGFAKITTVDEIIGQSNS